MLPPKPAPIIAPLSAAVYGLAVLGWTWPTVVDHQVVSSFGRTGSCGNRAAVGRLHGLHRAGLGCHLQHAPGGAQCVSALLS